MPKNDKKVEVVEDKLEKTSGGFKEIDNSPSTIEKYKKEIMDIFDRFKNKKK